LKPSYTIAKLASELGVGKARIKEWIRTGELVAHNLGSADCPRYRILAEAVQNFLKRREMTTQKPARKTSSRHRRRCSASEGEIDFFPAN
jgi:excisionase family DNA binding protein